jgi:two-component system, cell cycle sensor histidine kinase and response regulator CckA
MLSDARTPSVQISAAAGAFFAAALALVLGALDYALAAPGTPGLIERLANGGNGVLRLALFGVILSLVTSGLALWSIGWHAVKRAERAAAGVVQQTEALRQAERRHQESFEHAIVGLLRVAADGTIQAANPVLVRMLGYDTPAELVGKCATMLYRDPLDRERIVKEVGSRSAVSGVALAWQRRDGKALTVRVTSRIDRDSRGTLLGFDDIVEDVTERVALGEQLRHAQKMDAVGRLAGGIAHDFNNLLTVILGNAELLASDPSLAPSGQQCVDQIRNATTSAATVTRQLLMFSRKGTSSPQTIGVNRTVSYVEKMMARLIGEDIRVFSNLSPAVGAVLVDPAHLEQALINLAVNARDAMPSGGALIFETAPADNGRRVRIAVRDSGHGMDETTQQRAFEPFFTTKPAGKGTGLGLSMVYGFVQQAGGTISIVSTVGRGTTVTLEFPCTTAAIVPEETSSGQQRGNERLLVIEDQDSVRALIIGVLEKRGFTVFPATDAREARRVLATEPGIDLVITDVVMPGESGLDLADWLRGAYPRVSITFMSGHSDHPGMHMLPGQDLLRKPFTPSGLVAHVRRALDTRETPTRKISTPTTAA